MKIQEENNQKVIVIEDEVFDWGLDENALEEANNLADNLDLMRMIHMDIKEYFLLCMEEFTGSKPTIKEVYEELTSEELKETDEDQEWISFLDLGLYNLGQLKRYTNATDKQHS